MKLLKHTLLASLVAILFSSCVAHEHPRPHYGPHGFDGLAFFGIDYDIAHPYSYWDNNPSIPYNPLVGHYYNTAPGLYEFEYYVNPREFWYGTYEVWINYGGPGQPNGYPGYDGLDTYLLMICDPYGYYEVRGSAKIDEEALKTTPMVIERKEGNKNFKITLYKGDPSKRKTHEPKFRSSDLPTLEK